MSLLLVAQRALTVPGWAKDALWRRARAVPSLDLRFADNKSLVDAVTGASLVTFTRASSGTFTDSAGTLQTAVTNLLLRSEEFDNASWTKTRSSITADSEIAPNGTLTADKVVEDTTASATHLVSFGSGIIAGNTYTYSVYAKSAGRDWIVLSPGGSWGFAWFNISSGTIGTVTSGGSSATAAIQPVGNGWYRCSVTATAVDNRGLQILMATDNNVVTYTGNGTSGVFLWGAQLEQASIVGEYIPTTSVINSAPRFDHNPTTGESLGLLVEEARTNVVSPSADYSGANWVKTNIQVSASTTTAPDGSTCFAYEGSSASNLLKRLRFNFTATTVGTYTYSMYLKAGTENSCSISLQDNIAANGGFAEILLTNGTVIGAAGNFGANTGTTVSVQALSNGFYRISLTSTFVLVLAQIQAIITWDGTGSSTTTGTIFPWGAQLEAGAFPTSYIPTTTATATRAADVASITGTAFSSWYRQDEGTIYVQGSTSASASNPILLNIEDGTVNERIQIRRIGASNLASYLVTDGGVTQASATVSGFNADTIGRTCLAYALNNLQIAFNGALGTADTSATIPTVDRAFIGSASSPVYANGHISRLVFWPQALPSRLQSITQ